MGIESSKKSTQIFNFAVESYVEAVKPGMPLFEGKHVDNLFEAIKAVSSERHFDTISNVKTKGYTKKEVKFG
ncbi:MAG: hypothetical protein MRY79_08420 [Alphaproteobacteria bacterium]|nr:hypothetical protein [Alphaproteobacteria bacterium]